MLTSCSKKREEADRLEDDVRAQEEELTISPEETPTMPDSIDTSATDTAAPSIVADQQPPAYARPEPAGFVVQVASCPSQEYAEHLVDLYMQRGYQPYLTTTVHEGQTYHRVRIGGFAVYSEAKALKDEVQDKYSVSAWIDRSY
jgi:cell division septation protein DedD